MGKVILVIFVLNIRNERIETPLPNAQGLNHVMFDQVLKQSFEVSFYAICFIGNLKGEFKVILYSLRIEIRAIYR